MLLLGSRVTNWKGCEFVKLWLLSFT